MPVPHISRAPDAADYKSEGARPFFAYADSGLAASTDGRFGATFVRTVRAVRPGDGTGWHFHEAELQLIYIIHGSAVLDYEGIGRQTLKAGDLVFQPKGVRHDVVEVSADYQHLEIDMPAAFGTHPVDAPPTGLVAATPQNGESGK
ncbi:cupin domain-containing protein [Piscinibacter koreensis]|uniref:Cupin domain-containing protein n=1 Tax=Piscinibacter koreensis TaxID=2742824 RepID=A0A7Y6NRI1_9BURK|nr:cupin domain-containing protein [Schlegelella koreensis]NUZ08005.1 cupin domain-containing protein [Schlegelella koreensis]